MGSNKGFCMFYDWVDNLDILDGADAWVIVKAINAYCRDGVDPMETLKDEKAYIRAVAAMMLSQIRRREEVSAKRAKAGQAGNEEKKRRRDTEVKMEEAKVNSEVVSGDEIAEYSEYSEYSEKVERFWQVYPRKSGKREALRVFSALKPTDELVGVMVNAVRDQQRSDQWTRERGRYVPNPATWLSREPWLDVPVKPYSPICEGIEVSLDDLF